MHTGLVGTGCGHRATRRKRTSRSRASIRRTSVHCGHKGNSWWLGGLNYGEGTTLSHLEEGDQGRDGESGCDDQIQEEDDVEGND